MVKPIIVVGINRSGTKWLSNMISNHSDVIAVKNERHSGIIETNMFDNFQKAFGDLSKPDNYVGLIECWSKTDFFTVAGLAKEMYYQIEPNRRDYFCVFRMLMDKLAKTNGKTFWLQKTNPFNAINCIQNYKDAIFLIITRNIFDTIRSTIQMKINQGDQNKKIAKEIFFYKYQKR